MADSGSHLSDIHVGQAEEFSPTTPIAVRIGGLDTLPATFVNLVHVNFDNETFQLLFSQLTQPVITSSYDSREIGERGYVVAKCAARVLVTPDMAEEIVKVLTSTLDRFRELHSERQRDQELS